MSDEIEENPVNADVWRADHILSEISYGAAIDIYKARRLNNASEDEFSGYGYDSDDLNTNNNAKGEHNEDLIFDEIKKSIKSGSSYNNSDASQFSVTNTYTDKETSPISSLTFGFIPKACYQHTSRSGAILGLCHNSRYKQFNVLDAKGITGWRYDTQTESPVSRQLDYPAYQYRLYSNLVYAKKHNVYFCLGKDFSLKILNHHFEETYTVDANLRNVMFLLYNTQKEELITGGVGGTKIWQFVQVVEDKGWTEVKAMSNYKLQHKYTLHNVGGGWVKKVELDYELSHLYCCSETDLHAYDLHQGHELFSFVGAHDMSITGCVYSESAQLLVTTSMDSTVKCWIINGGLVHTFRCHSKAVTQALCHPDTSSLILTCSMDCTIKVLSLDTLSVLYSVTVSSDGLKWMGLTHDNTLYSATDWQITMWNLNQFLEYFAVCRADLISLKLQSAPKKSTRLVAVSDDSCVRLFSPKQRKHLCTVLPMPYISPLEQVKAVCYSRELNLVYCLINDVKLWIYTTRTDPACRIAQWDLLKIQNAIIKKLDIDDGEGSSLHAMMKKLSTQRAVGDGHVNVETSHCTAIGLLNSHVMMWGDEGWVGTVPTKFLLVGLEDGRILFMDPFVRGLMHVDFRASKDAIRDICHDPLNHQLITRCDRNEVCLVQVWGLPTLQLQHELVVYQNVICFMRLGDNMMFGFNDGAISFLELDEVDEDNINRRTNQIKSKEELRQSNLLTLRYEHREEILNIDCCRKKQLFLSCGKDGYIKLWSGKSQCVIADIHLDTSLSFASFLNKEADIVLGFNKHIYTISILNACPYQVGLNDTASSTIAESDIYEDPTITHEGVYPSPDPLDLRTYLKPFELDITKDFLEATDIVVRPETKQSGGDEEFDVLSNAPTEIYNSPRSTPRGSRMDVFTPEPIQLDQISTHSGRKTPARVKKEEISQKLLDILDVTNPKVADYYLPMFGESPGGTPSVSSISISDSRSDLDMSDLDNKRPLLKSDKRPQQQYGMAEFDFDSDFSDEEQHGELSVPKKPQQKKDKPSFAFLTRKRPEIVIPQEFFADLESKKKKKRKKEKLQLTIEPDELTAVVSEKTDTKSKYGVDKMQVDVASLMKTTKKTKKSTGAKLSAEEQREAQYLRDSLQAGAAEVRSKKKTAGPRKRVPAGKKTGVTKPSSPDDSSEEEKPKKTAAAKPKIQKLSIIASPTSAAFSSNIDIVNLMKSSLALGHWGKSHISRLCEFETDKSLAARLSATEKVVPDAEEKKSQEKIQTWLQDSAGNEVIECKMIEAFEKAKMRREPETTVAWRAAQFVQSISAPLKEFKSTLCKPMVSAQIPALPEVVKLQTSQTRERLRSVVNVRRLTSASKSISGHRHKSAALYYHSDVSSIQHVHADSVVPDTPRQSDVSGRNSPELVPDRLQVRSKLIEQAAAIDRTHGRLAQIQSALLSSSSETIQLQSVSTSSLALSDTSFNIKYNTQIAYDVRPYASDTKLTVNRTQIRPSLTRRRSESFHNWNCKLSTPSPFSRPVAALSGGATIQTSGSVEAFTSESSDIETPIQSQQSAFERLDKKYQTTRFISNMTTATASKEFISCGTRAKKTTLPLDVSEIYKKRKRSSKKSKKADKVKTNLDSNFEHQTYIADMDATSENEKDVKAIIQVIPQRQKTSLGGVQLYDKHSEMSRNENKTKFELLRSNTVADLIKIDAVTQTTCKLDAMKVVKVEPRWNVIQSVLGMKNMHQLLTKLISVGENVNIQKWAMEHIGQDAFRRRIDEALRSGEVDNLISVLEPYIESDNLYLKYWLDALEVDFSVIQYQEIPKFLWASSFSYKQYYNNQLYSRTYWQSDTGYLNESQVVSDGLGSSAPISNLSNSKGFSDDREEMKSKSAKLVTLSYAKQVEKLIRHGHTATKKRAAQPARFGLSDQIKSIGNQSFRRSVKVTINRPASGTKSLPNNSHHYNTLQTFTNNKRVPTIHIHKPDDDLSANGSSIYPKELIYSDEDGPNFNWNENNNNVVLPSGIFSPELVTLHKLYILSLYSDITEIALRAVDAILLVVNTTSSDEVIIVAMKYCILVWFNLRENSVKQRIFKLIIQLAREQPINSNALMVIIAFLMRMISVCENISLRHICANTLYSLSVMLHSSPHTTAFSYECDKVKKLKIQKHIATALRYCTQLVILSEREVTPRISNRLWHSKNSYLKISSCVTGQLTKHCRNNQVLKEVAQLAFKPCIAGVQVYNRRQQTSTPTTQPAEQQYIEQHTTVTLRQRLNDITYTLLENIPYWHLPSTLKLLIHNHKSTQTYTAELIISSSVTKQIADVKTVTGSLASGLVPASTPTAVKKKEVPKRKGTVLDVETQLKFTAETVNIPGDEPLHEPRTLRNLAYNTLKNKLMATDMKLFITKVHDDWNTMIQNNKRGDNEDDVELSPYMTAAEDDMECKSAASWNPTFDFEPGGGESPDLTKLGLGRRVTSGRTLLRERFLQTAGSPEPPRIKVSVRQRTPAFSEIISDMDAMSIQLDDYDIEGQFTPQPSISESAAGESIAAGSFRLPNLLDDVTADSAGGEFPVHTDALSRWVMGSMPRAMSAAESETATRPGTSFSEIELGPSPWGTAQVEEPKSILKVSSFIEDKIRQRMAGTRGKRSEETKSPGDEPYARPVTMVTNLGNSPMLGYREVPLRPHTAPTPARHSYADLEEAFELELMKYQGNGDINRLFRNDATDFDGNWQAKSITRHRLLMMQKEIRARSAVHRKRLMEQRQVDRRHALTGHRHCDGMIEEKQSPLANIARSQHRLPNSRVGTAATTVTVGQDQNPVTRVDIRAMSARTDGADSAGLKDLQEKASRLNESHVQYRLRINENLCQQMHESLRPLTAKQQPSDSVVYNPRSIDPRRPETVRHPTSRSIPSRCTQYVLVKHKRNSDKPSYPSPLEKTLLSERFPNYAQKVMAQAVGEHPIRVGASFKQPASAAPLRPTVSLQAT